MGTYWFLKYGGISFPTSFLYVASFRLFKPVRSEPLHDNRKFLHISFANKGIDAINISNILNRKEVVKEIPPYFKNQYVPIVSYSYTNSIGRKIFNNKEELQDINIEDPKSLRSLR
jgi:hypothetical protein